MTDERRRSPLAGWAGIATGRLRVAEEPFTAQLAVRGDPVAAGSALGLTLPTVPNTLSRTGSASALWLGPAEWLVLGGSRPDPDAGERWSAADVSAQRTCVVVAGPATLDLLAHGCSLDLARVAPQWCAQTDLARAGVILYGVDPGEVRILVRASFARYLADWLTDAATELA